MSAPHFRYKPSINRTMEEQGVIYWRSRMYRSLPPDKKVQIRYLCAEAGGEYADAVLQFVSTDTGATAISLRHNLSRETLDRCVRRYYEKFPVGEI